MFGAFDSLLNKVGVFRLGVSLFLISLVLVIAIYFFPIHFVRSELKISSTGYYSINYSYTLKTISKDGITVMLESKIETKDHKNNLVEQKV